MEGRGSAGHSLGGYPFLNNIRYFSSLKCVNNKPVLKALLVLLQTQMLIHRTFYSMHRELHHPCADYLVHNSFLGPYPCVRVRRQVGSQVLR